MRENADVFDKKTLENLRSSSPHEFVSNPLFPLLCKECGREKLNAKYHLQAVTR